MDNKVEELKEKIEVNTLDLLDMFYSIQEDIYNKYKNNSKTTIYEIYLYKVVTNAISILRNNYFNVEPSLTQIYSYKVMLESYAIMMLYEDSKEDLYDLYSSYEMYDKYKYMSAKSKKIALSKIIDKNLANLIKNDQDAYIKLIKEKLPFLLDDFSFEKIIDKMDSNLTFAYSCFKVLSDPISNIIRNDNEILNELESNKILTMAFIIKKISDYFNTTNIEKKEYNINFIEFYQKKFLSNVEDVSKNMDYIAESCGEIDYLEELKNTLLVLKDALKDISYDAIYDQYEIVASKSKIMIEAISASYQVLNYQNIDSNFISFFSMKCFTFSKIYFLSNVYLKNINLNQEDTKKDIDELKSLYETTYMVDLTKDIINYNNPINYFMEVGDSLNVTIENLVDQFIDEVMGSGSDANETYNLYDDANSFARIKAYYNASKDYASALFSTINITVLISLLLHKYMTSFRENKMFDLDKNLYNFGNHITRYLAKILNSSGQCNKLILKIIK